MVFHNTQGFVYGDILFNTSPNWNSNGNNWIGYELLNFQMDFITKKLNSKHTIGFFIKIDAKLIKLSTNSSHCKTNYIY